MIHIEEAYAYHPEPDETAFRKAMETVSRELPDWVDELLEVTKTVSVRLYANDQNRSLSSHIKAYMNGKNDSGNYYLSAWNGFVWWHQRLMSRLGELALESEKALPAASAENKDEGSGY